MGDLFSERISVKQPQLLQVDSIDGALRNALWSVLVKTIWIYVVTDNDINPGEPVKRLIDDIWEKFLKRPIDTSPGYRRTLSVAPGYIKEIFLNFRGMKYTILSNSLLRHSTMSKR